MKLSVASQTVRQPSSVQQRDTNMPSLPAKHQTVGRRRRAEKQQTHVDSFMSRRGEKSSAFCILPPLRLFLSPRRLQSFSLSASTLDTFITSHFPAALVLRTTLYQCPQKRFQIYFYFIHRLKSPSSCLKCTILRITRQGR